LVGSALALAVAAAIAVSVSLAARQPETAAADLMATDVTGVNWGRDFHLIGDDGAPHELAEFRGKVIALYFGYTRCPDVCPLTLATLAESVRLLGDDGKDVQVIFVTVDPKHDKPKLLGQYVRSFHQGFLALYGNAAATARTAAEFKVEGGQHHSTPVFLFDATGRLRLVAHPEASAESLAHDMRGLLVRRILQPSDALLGGRERNAVTLQKALDRRKPELHALGVAENKVAVVSEWGLEHVFGLDAAGLQSLKP
jgi:protein SCO1/2